MSLITEQKRAYWEKLAKEDLESMVKRIEKRRPRASERVTRDYAYSARTGLDEEIFDIVSGDTDISEMVKELENVGKHYAANTVQRIRNGLIAGGFIKRKRTKKGKIGREILEVIKRDGGATCHELQEKLEWSAKQITDALRSLEKIKRFEISRPHGRAVSQHELFGDVVGRGAKYIYYLNNDGFVRYLVDLGLYKKGDKAYFTISRILSERVPKVHLLFKRCVARRRILDALEERELNYTQLLREVGHHLPFKDVLSSMLDENSVIENERGRGKSYRLAEK